jgi:hypothetical protein
LQIWEFESQIRVRAESKRQFRSSLLFTKSVLRLLNMGGKRSKSTFYVCSLRRFGSGPASFTSQYIIININVCCVVSIFAGVEKSNRRSRERQVVTSSSSQGVSILERYQPKPSLGFGSMIHHPCAGLRPLQRPLTCYEDHSFFRITLAPLTFLPSGNTFSVFRIW